MGTRLAACQMTHQVQAGCIRPVQIIEKEDKHRGETDRLQEGSDRFIEAKACLLKGKWIGNGEISKTCKQLWQDAGKQWGGSSHLLAQLIQGSFLNVGAKCL